MTTLGESGAMNSTGRASSAQGPNREDWGEPRPAESPQQATSTILSLKTPPDAERPFSGPLDPKQVWQKTAASIHALLRALNATLYRVDRESGALEVLAWAGEVGPTVGPHVVFPRRTGLAGLAVRKRRPVVTPNQLTDPRVRLTPDVRAHLELAGHRAALAVPLIAAGVVIGALEVGDRAGRVFKDKEIHLAQTVCELAALALEHARLHAEAQRALAGLKATHEECLRDETLRALGELGAGAAHHLNNLLTVLLLRIELLLPTVHAPATRDSLKMMEQAATDAAEVVRRLQRFVQMQPVDEAEAVDLNQVAADALEMTRVRWLAPIQGQGIPIDAALEAGDVPPVMASAVALREVVMNLILNALEAVPGGGRITLRTVLANRMVCLAVSDTGAGMSEEVRRRALEPFFTTKGPQRTGLGLSLAYGILQQYRGELAMESATGRGTTVTIRLPAAQTTAPSHGQRTRSERSDDRDMVRTAHG
ncbi:MAG: GAF domain-containing protein [Candidatus Rokubacteria bacterium]|nr:GAF domain-containing protein [Candidatus Rokubacteria bacterium]